MDSHFKSLFYELYEPLCIYSMRIVGDRDVAEDIVQEQFIYIWENNKKLENRASIKSYLYSAVRHKSIDFLRSRYNRNKERLKVLGRCLQWSNLTSKIENIQL